MTRRWQTRGPTQRRALTHRHTDRHTQTDRHTDTQTDRLNVHCYVTGVDLGFKEKRGLKE